jgi:hypothetical protein
MVVNSGDETADRVTFVGAYVAAVTPRQYLCIHGGIGYTRFVLYCMQALHADVRTGVSGERGEERINHGTLA